MRKHIFIFCAVFFVFGALVGKFVWGASLAKEGEDALDDELTEVREGGYKYISPLLECETGKDTYRLNGLNDLRSEVTHLVENEKIAGNVTDVAVYFRDLNNGPWFGVNEHVAFSPASLLKLPVMMAYYKKSEVDSELLNRKVKYDENLVLLEQSISPTNQIEKGKEYAIDDLIKRMMVYSDNATLAILEENIEPARIDEITLDLGVETATAQSPEDFMSVKGYAGLFRILYNASYIKKELSEKALEILSKAEFNYGLVAGVPKGISVAHKFGERTLEQNISQLHDCGIIYRKNNPYLLCIMTRGSNLNNLEKVISKISAVTYQGLERRASQLTP